MTKRLWLHDSRYIAFFTGGKLRKIASAGGAVQTLCSGRLGGTWNRDGAILFSDRESPLYRVSDTGGTPEPVTKLAAGETSHRWPWFLPDGKHFLFTAFAWGAAPRLWLGSLDGTPPKPLLKMDGNALFAPPGYVLFLREGTLMAQPFDPGRLEFTGPALPAAESVGANGSIGQMLVSVSSRGHLLYRSEATVEKLEWRDRAGKVVGELTAVDVNSKPTPATKSNAHSPAIHNISRFISMRKGAYSSPVFNSFDLIVGYLNVNQRTELDAAPFYCTTETARKPIPAKYGSGRLLSAGWTNRTPEIDPAGRFLYAAVAETETDIVSFDGLT